MFNLLLTGSFIFLSGSLIFLSLRNRKVYLSNLQKDQIILQAENSLMELKVKNEELEAVHDAQREELLELSCTARELTTRIDELNKAHRDKVSWLEASQTKLQESFQQLTAKALTQNNQSFLELAGSHLKNMQEKGEKQLDLKKQEMQSLLNPLKETLDHLHKQRESEDKKWHQTYGSIQEVMSQQSDALNFLSKETHHLTHALRTPNFRGVWGEVQLKRVVELSGMKEHCDFDTQVHLVTEKGESQRPDMVIHLPHERKLIVDAKAPLKAYLEAFDCSDPQEKKERLKQHKEQLNRHIQHLSLKAYWENLPQSTDFVVLFLPGDSFLQAALEQDPSLIEQAAAKKILLATPTTLIALLKSASLGWKHHEVAEQIDQFTVIGKELYERLVKMNTHFSEVRKGLERAMESYNSAMGSFESRVLVSARKLSELSPEPKKLPGPKGIDISLRKIQNSAQKKELKSS